MVDYQTVLKLARQGDAQAIGLLVNQALVTKGIQVRAVRKDTCLHVLLEGSQVPDRLTYSRIVYAAVLCLGASTIKTLQVYGRQKDDRQPVWSQAFALRKQEEEAVADDRLDVQRQEQSSEALPKQVPLMGTQTMETQTAAKPPSEQRPTRPKRIKPHSPPQTAPRSKLVPIAISICASFGFGAGMSYLNSVKSETVDSPDAASDPAANPADNSALAAFPTPTTPPLPTPSPAASVSSPAPVAVTIKAVGDIIPGSNYPGKWLPTEPGEQLAAEREFLFGNIKPFFDEADILFGNFESTLTDYPYPAKDTSQGMTFAFRTPPVYAQMLKDLGFDVLSVANNHSFDFGDQGFADTITHIEQAGMKAVGKKGQIVYTTVNGITVAFIGFSYLPDHNLMHDLATAGALVQEAKQQAKIVVISVHAGAEGSDQVHTKNQTEYFFGEDRGNLVQFAHGLIDQGADLILGHGPHVPRAVELYQGKLIAYSLGNFVGYETLSTVGTLGYSLILKAQMDADGNFVGGRIIPVALDGHGIPKLDDFFQSVVLIRNLTQSDFPQSPVRIDDMGYILPVSN
jgi:poly-gamma-glutamate capsule biosynthesis protein CapA/YwtB (metallophosphatase superfamily)